MDDYYVPVIRHGEVGDDAVCVGLVRGLEGEVVGLRPRVVLLQPLIDGFHLVLRETAARRARLH